MKQILSIFITILGLFLATNVFAKIDQEIAQKYGISFPIAELGNCENIDKCKVFCDKSYNHQRCIDFAQQHNINTESPPSSSKSDEEILKLAQVELGCSSIDQCMAFCEREENMEKCMDFASKHNLGDPSASIDKMNQVKNLLGCSSIKACMDFCNNPDNQTRCLEVFKQAGMSVEVNYSEQVPNEPPQVWCPKVGENCSWDGSQCTCFSQTPPSTYQQSPSFQQPPEEWCPKAGDNCKWTGQECVCGSAGGTSEYTPESPEVWCPKAGTNCSWDGKQCSCGQTTDTTQQTSTQSTTPPADNPYTVQGGETIYKSECLSAGCRWSDNPNSCDCAGVGKDVQGVSTNQGLLFQILDFIF